MRLVFGVLGYELFSIGVESDSDAQYVHLSSLLEAAEDNDEEETEDSYGFRL